MRQVFGILALGLLSGCNAIGAAYEGTLFHEAVKNPEFHRQMSAHDLPLNDNRVQRPDAESSWP